MGGFPKENKQEKNDLCENSVEVWGNDGKYLGVCRIRDGKLLAPHPII